VQISHKLRLHDDGHGERCRHRHQPGVGRAKGLTGTIGFWGNSSQAADQQLQRGLDLHGPFRWAATNFANLYGANAANNLTGKPMPRWRRSTPLSSTCPVVQAQVLATAAQRLRHDAVAGRHSGQAYGFSVSATGLGACSFNVGKDGAAFGVPNKTTLNVYQLLSAVNKKAVNGLLYDGDGVLQGLAAALFQALNNSGKIG
jgi:hypothetical protein